MPLKRVREILALHLLDCAKYMPESWVKKNGGEFSEFMIAYNRMLVILDYYEVLKDEMSLPKM